MGVERKGNNVGSTRSKQATDPGLGTPSSGRTGVARSVSTDDPKGPSDVVDFNALHAALGHVPTPSAASSSEGESRGKSNATYASARPHTIPPTRPPADDPNAPAVIVQVDDTVPSGPPKQMTVPLGRSPAGIRSPGAAGQAPFGRFDGPPHADPAIQPNPRSATATKRLAGNPRRYRLPTVVVREREPSRAKKILVFIAMLLVFVGGGIALLVYLRPPGLNLDAGSASTPSAVKPPKAVSPTVTVVPQAPGAPAITGLASSGSAKVPVRRLAP